MLTIKVWCWFPLRLPQIKGKYSNVYDLTLLSGNINHLYNTYIIYIYITSVSACYKISYHILILTLNKSSILPSFFSKSEFLLFSSADIFSIVRSDYRDKEKINSELVSKYYMSSHFSSYFFRRKHLQKTNSLESHGSRN